MTSFHVLPNHDLFVLTCVDCSTSSSSSSSSSTSSSSSSSSSSVVVVVVVEEVVLEVYCCYITMPVTLAVLSPQSAAPDQQRPMPLTSSTLRLAGGSAAQLRPAFAGWRRGRGRRRVSDASAACAPC